MSDCRIDVFVKVETNAISHGRGLLAFLVSVMDYSS
jgi:hypothetical protein